MSEAEQATLEAIQLELFALEREYGDLVADFYAKRREILKRRRRVLNTLKRPIVPQGKKQCGKCFAVKDKTDFYAESRYSDGRRPYCIECDLGRMKRYNETIRKGNVLARGRVA